jgi:VanZ family protein
MACFGTWTLLLAAARIFGPGLAWRNILICVLVSAAYAAVDESLQAIPFIHRSAEFADYFANLKGIGMAGILLALIRLTVGRSGQGEDGPGT